MDRTAAAQLREINDGVRHIAQANIVQGTGYGLNGTGVTVMLYDGGTAWASHEDFGNRVHVRDGSGLSFHATHVAGTIGGSGSREVGSIRGIASGAVIESYGFEYDGSGTFLYTNPGDLEADYSQAISTYGAMIANNSIGTNLAINGYPCEYEGDYGLTSMLLDAIVGGSLGIAHAGGLCQRKRAGFGAGAAQPIARRLRRRAEESDHRRRGELERRLDDVVFELGSDGRRAAEAGSMRAPGCQSGGDGGVTSTAIGGGYMTLCAARRWRARRCTGMSALLLQQWSAVQSGIAALPRNATLKAVLVQSAVDLGSIGPDYQTGYGSARVQDAVDLLAVPGVRESEIAGRGPDLCGRMSRRARGR